jgi:hypothetical protein
MRSIKQTIAEALVLAELLRPSWPSITGRIARSGHPTCFMAEGELKAKLKAVEAELSQAREEHAVLQREFDEARAAFAKSPDADPSSRVFKRAELVFGLDQPP